MILVVTAINTSEAATSLDVSDGWYTMRATIDEPLAALVRKRGLALGMKIAVCGAELVGAEAGSGLHPLELELNQVHDQFEWPTLPGESSSRVLLASGKTSLTIRYNSTRPTRFVKGFPFEILYAYE